jgi:hypothetical protein
MFKARVYAQLGGRSRSSGGNAGSGGSGGSYACNSAESNLVASAATPQQVQGRAGWGGTQGRGGPGRTGPGAGGRGQGLPAHPPGLC